MQGVHHDAAFAQAFAGVSLAELEQQYRKHAVELSAPLHEGDRLTAFVTTAYTPRVAAPVRDAVALSDAQVHLTFLRLRDWQPPYRDAANAELVSAQVDSPEDPEVHYWHALYEWRTGAPNKAVTLLREAIDASKPLELVAREGRYRLAIVQAQLAELEKGGHKVTPAELAPLAEDFKQLQRVARSGTELDQVARVKMAAPEAGIPFAMRATQADPTCFYCFDTLAQLHAARGKFAQAAQAEERAFSLLPEHVTMPRIKLRLDEYRQKATASSER